jgi:protein TonB
MSGRPVPALVRLRTEFRRPGSPGQAPGVSAGMSMLPSTPLPAGADVESLDLAGHKPPDLRMPKVLREVQPRYTMDAMRAKVQGTVRVEILILDDGTIGATRATRRLDQDLDEQALIAARYWLFEPARRGGRPLAVTAYLDLSFTLK